jgi:hypothetical protein
MIRRDNVFEIPELRNRTGVFWNREHAGKVLSDMLLSFKNTDSNKIIIAVPTAHLKSLELIIPNVYAVFCANIRGGWGFAVVDAYKNWCDV